MENVSLSPNTREFIDHLENQMKDEAVETELLTPSSDGPDDA
jgi:hypothetical protein